MGVGGPSRSPAVWDKSLSHKSQGVVVRISEPTCLQCSDCRGCTLVALDDPVSGGVPSGCQEIAEEFRAQEIDGQALLLLKEDHLMSAMNIKLGPALKIYARINMLKDS